MGTSLLLLANFWLVMGLMAFIIFLVRKRKHAIDAEKRMRDFKHKEEVAEQTTDKINSARDAWADRPR